LGLFLLMSVIFCAVQHQETSPNQQSITKSSLASLIHCHYWLITAGLAVERCDLEALVNSESVCDNLGLVSQHKFLTSFVPIL